MKTTTRLYKVGKFFNNFYFISRTRILYMLLLIFSFSSFFITDVFGIAKTFTGGVGFNFGNATMWNGGTLPVAGDDLTINGICIIDDNVLTDNIVYGTIVIGGASPGALSWVTGGTNRLNIANISSSFAGSSLDMSNGGTLIIRGTWASANLAFTQGNGTIDIRSAITLPAAYSSYNNLIINGTGFTVGLAAATMVTGNLTLTDGTFNLNTFTLTITGDATYTAGTINNGTVTSSGATSIFAGTAFGAIVNATSNMLYLNGSTFNNTVTLTKNGATDILCSGGNTFNNTATIVNSSVGYLILGNTAPDIFNGNVTFTNTGSSELQVAYNAPGNQFNGNVTFNNTGTGSSIQSSYNSPATAIYSGNIVVNNTAIGGIYFGSMGGTTTLAVTKTITKGGTGFTKGSLVLSYFTQSGTTAQILSFTGTSLLQLGPSSTFNGDVNFTSPQVLLEGCTLNGTASIAKSGASLNVSTGGNIFNGVTTLSNSGSGSFDMGDTSPETFNGNLTMNNTGTGRIQIGISSVGNLFNGNVTMNYGGNNASNLNMIIARNAGATATINGNLTLNCTNLNSGSGIIIANDAAVTINGNITVSSTSGRGILFGAAAGSVTLASGFTITDAGAGTFTTGTLTLSRFTQLGGTAQNIALTGTANLLLDGISVFNGAVNFSASQLFLNGCQFNSTSLLTKNGATDNTSTGGNKFNAATSITNSGTGFLRLANSAADDFNTDATFIQAGSGLLQPAYATNCTFAGNLLTTGTATAIIFGGTLGTVTLNGAIAQSIGGPFSITFNNLTIADAGNTVTPGVNCIVNNNLSVSNGTFDLGGFTSDRSTSGGTITVSNNATLKIGSTNSFPLNYATAALGTTSTVNYSGTAQTIDLQNYGHLTLSNSGVKTMPSSVLLIAGTFTMSGTTSATALNSMTIGGAVILNPGSAFIAGSLTHSVAGNWTNNLGTFTPGASTIVFNGSVAQAINGTAASQTFNNLIVAKSAGTLSVNGSTSTLTTNDFTETSGNFTAPLIMNIIGTATSSLTLVAGTFTAGLITTITGNWTNNGGTFTPGINTVVFNGSGAQAITGTSAAQSFYNFIIMKPAGIVLSTSGSTTTLTAQDFTETSGDFLAPAILNINGNRTLTADVFTAGAITNVKGNWTNNGGTFNPGFNTVVFNGSGTQSINGLAVSQTFYNLIIAKSTGSLLNSGGSTIALTTNDFTETSGNFTPPATLNINGNLLLTAGTFTAGTLTNLQGNWTRNGGTFTPGTRTVVFNGTGIKTIGGSSVTSFYILTLNTAASADIVQLTNNVTVTSALNLAMGVLDLNSKSIAVTSGLITAITRTSGYILSEKTDNSSKVIWSIGATLTSHIFPFGTASGLYVPFTLNLTGGNIGNVTVSTYPTAFNNTPYPTTPVLVTNMYSSTGSDNSANVVDRFWQINKDGQTGTATLTFVVTPAEAGTITGLTAQRYESSINKWQLPLTGQTSTATSATVPGVSTFSPWTLSGNGAMLPIELLDFTAALIETHVDLTWSTASELNNDYFTVEKTVDLLNYEQVAVIQGAGNSIQLLTYSTPDVNPYSGLSYYRLKQTDYNGTETYSNLVSVYVNSSDDHAIVYPNPVVGTTFSIKLPNESVNELQVVIYNLSGQMMLTKKVTAGSDGSFTIAADTPEKLSSGVYLLSLFSINSSYQEKLIIQ